MAWIWICTSTSLILFLYLLQTIVNKRLPPGPIGLPIIGHFHLLGKNPHQDLAQLARKHGPIMRLRFGSIPTIIVSSPAAAQLFLKTNDIVFCSRPHHECSYYLAYEQRNLVFGRYGEYWRNMRKLCTLHLLSNVKINQFRAMREHESRIGLDFLKQAAQNRQVVDLSVRIAMIIANITCLMVFGKKYEEKDLDDKLDLKGILKATMHEAAAFNIGDYFPYLRGLDLQGSSQRLKNLSNIFDGFLEKIIQEHVDNRNDKKETLDFVDTLMGILESGQAGFDFDRRHVKALLLDMLLAGIDTSAAAIEWAMSEIIRHPQLTKKLQKELEEVVGMGQMVEESHLPNLRRLDYFVRESMRLHPVGPLLIHESMEDCQVDGFYIPKNTRVLVNVWAIGRDPDAWSDPETFSPDRFLENNVDLRGRDFELIPFGSGRRGCPGLQLGLTIVQLIVAQLVHCFDWELPDGARPTDLDMTENFGLVVTRAEHLMAIPSYRLHNK